MDEGGTPKGLSERIAERIEKLIKCDCPKQKCYWCEKTKYCKEHECGSAACYDCNVKFIIEDEELEEELERNKEADWKCALCQKMVSGKTLTCPNCEDYDYGYFGY